MHPYSWNGFPKGYQENFHNFVDAVDEIQVNPDLEPLWAAPSCKLARNDTIEYTGCFHGSKCKLVMKGECKRLHPRQTEVIAAAISKEKERSYRQLNYRTSKTSTNDNKEIARPRNNLDYRVLKQLKYNKQYSIAVNQPTINVSNITGTIIQASYARTQKHQPKFKESQRRHADESTLISKQDTT
jgi:hypothetical protein